MPRGVDDALSVGDLSSAAESRVTWSWGIPWLAQYPRIPSPVDMRRMYHSRIFGGRVARWD